MSETKDNEGWGYLVNAPKWHYFRGGRSLCGKWMCLQTSGLEQGNDASADNCAQCRKRLDAQRALTKGKP